MARITVNKWQYYSICFYVYSCIALDFVHFLLDLAGK